MFLNIYYWEKLTFSKPVGKVHFSERNLKKCTSFEEQKSTRYIWKNLYLPLSFVYKTVTQISFKLFCSGDKKILSEFLRKWGWFQGYNECFPKYLGEKFQKTETRCCRGKSTDNNNINIFLSLENPCTFLLAKEKTWKRIFNTNSELLQNRTRKQIIPFKTTVNWLFNNIWCYLVICCFDWKIAVFQQTVLRGLLYP